MNKLLNKLKNLPKKTKLIGIGGVAVVLVVGIIAVASINSKSKDEFALKTKVITKNIGDNFTLTPKDVLNTEDLEILNNAVFMKNGNERKELTFQNITKNDVGRAYEGIDNYLKENTYDYAIRYKEKELNFKVEFKDKSKPGFKDFKEQITIEQNALDFDYKDYFKALDETGIKEFKIDASKVKLDTVGEYEISVYAEDNYKNKTTKKSIVKIVDKEEAKKGVTPTMAGKIPKSQLRMDEENQEATNNNEALQNNDGTNKSNNSSTNTSNSNNGGSSSNNGSSGEATTGTDGGGNTGGSTGGGGTATPPSDVCSGFRGHFKTWSEADNWAYYQPVWKGGGYTVSGIDGCGFDVSWNDGTFN